jgi:2-polyprenyl-6-methoxyphenol hydroxylase-like FAD-dependent oxidoreductase
VRPLTRADRVVIVGAGIGGLTLAMALRRRGFGVTVVERAAALHEVGAGVLLWPNAMRALDQLGVGRAIEHAGAIATHGDLRSPRGALLADGLVGGLVAGPGARLVVVHRALLQSILLPEPGSGVLRLGAECVGVVQDGAGATVRVADGSSERGEVVVGADGLRSLVRSSLVKDQPPRYSGYVTWRGVVPLDRVLSDRLRPGESWGRGELFGAARLGGNQAYWWASARTGERPGGSPADEKAAVAQRFGGWHEPIPELIDATPEQAIVRCHLYERPALACWSAGRVGVLGDAAHPMLASFGQGACQAIEDAAALAEALAGDPDSAAALLSYGLRRAPGAEVATRRSWQVARLAHLHHPLAVALRNALVSALPSELLLRGLAPVIEQRGEPEPMTAA